MGGIINLEKCTGLLEHDDKVVEITFSLKCEATGNLVFDFESIPYSSDVRWVNDRFRVRTKYANTFKLTARCESEKLDITADSFFISSLSHSSSGLCITSANCNVLKAVGPPRQKECWYAQYQIQGLEGLPDISAMTSLGEITVAGSMKVADYDKISGWVTIRNEKRPRLSFPNWVKECDSLVRRVLDVFSFAHGKYYRWAFSQYGNKQKTYSHFYGKKKSDQPAYPVFYYLNPLPTLELALSNYTQAIQNETGFDVAIKWLLEPQLYEDTAYISLFCALEHIIDSFSKNHINMIIAENSERKKIGKHIKKAITDYGIGTSSKLTEDQLHFIKLQVSGLFRYPLEEKLKQMLNFYHIPFDDIVQDLKVLIKIRNEVVHRGVLNYENSTEDIRAHDYTAMIKELLVRILLAILKYEGKYLSYLNGQEEKVIQYLSVEELHRDCSD